MKRLCLAVVLGLGLVMGLFALADATQNRPDDPTPGTRTEIAFTVDVKDFGRGEAGASAALWSVCSATVDGEVSPVPTASDARWVVSISPALGEHGEKRLVGCLEDATIDRVSATVVALRDE